MRVLISPRKTSERNLVEFLEGIDPDVRSEFLRRFINDSFNKGLLGVEGLSLTPDAVHENLRTHITVLEDDLRIARSEIERLRRESGLSPVRAEPGRAADDTDTDPADSSSSPSSIENQVAPESDLESGDTQQPEPAAAPRVVSAFARNILGES